MISKSILTLMATAALLETGLAVPLVSENIGLDLVTRQTESPAVYFKTFSDSPHCAGNARMWSYDDGSYDDGGCHSLSAYSMEVTWFANTCRDNLAFIYRGSTCEHEPTEIQVQTGTCYDTSLYHKFKVFCH
ncbi:uncharacterized protein CC84DRAFT_1176528 [Paraphaeosphaeria sporulosa]|uniref:Uncharacterized protein n=1 Tax=Paraphaeosphaeria sporulosa TaxID=1460663 RepID=A0A177CBS7_9PLEO|nr:uncharacterized protein CC84DRAFT_1176528 [Paraphaeosphaeria sporulosa]OAG04279.1 hypothetical protein CC84DRAFT_1176528 [Paraphaeosphaeria sporulosa]